MGTCISGINLASQCFRVSRRMSQLENTMSDKFVVKRYDFIIHNDIKLYLDDIVCLMREFVPKRIDDTAKYKSKTLA